MLKNFTVIEVISSKTKAQLSFYPNKFKFNQFTAPDLENPPYVQFLIDTNGKNFAIRVCEKTDENATLPLYAITDSRFLYEQESDFLNSQTLNKLKKPNLML